jgi:HD-like signal output (HDOD) protein
MFWNLFRKKPAQAFDNNIEKKFKPEISNKPLPIRKVVNIPVSFLNKLIPVSQLLDGKDIQKLQITAANFLPGSIIFNRGTESDSLIYIVKGYVYMESNNGSIQEIVAGSFKALYPLSAGKQHCMTAIAKTDVTVIYISLSALLMERPVTSFENKLNIPKHLGNNSFFNSFYENLMQGDLKTPNLPNTTIKFNQAVQQGCDIKAITKIINLDPVIAAKLIQVVNSPIYRLPDPITSSFDAINRLGLQTTRNLVTAFSMKNLIKCETPLIKKHIQETWMQSIKVSSISCILAQLTKRVDPNEALLAGLLHNIGALPILVFADSLPEHTYQSIDIDICINEMQGQIGTIILEKWGVPDKLKQIPLQATNWFADNGKGLDLNDIVLLAKYHHLLNSFSDTKLPLISTLPVFQKLDNQQLTPEMSLQVIQDAQQQISETMKVFMA